jgi:hypothetical protein
MSKFASLTSGLLARKGLAEPAATHHADSLLARVDASGPDFRPQGPFGRRSHSSVTGLLAQREAMPHVPQAVRPCLAPEPAAVALAAETTAPHCCPDGNGDPERLFHVSLRLKRRRFVKLKLSAALLRRPTQDIVGEALDHWFDGLPAGMLGDCPCIRAR